MISNSNKSPALTSEKQQLSKNSSIRTLILTSLLVFGLAFAAPPLSRFTYAATDTNRSPTISGAVLAPEITAENTPDQAQQSPPRDITVQFNATIRGNVAWEFRPSVRSIVVKPGERTRISYYVKNHSDKSVVTQSIPAITPWQATKYLKKIECFCFDTQVLQAGEAKDMGLLFVIDPELPEDIDTITLSYTIMDTHRTE
ncbi:MAG: cytochrome c oxidase assembly protein [Moraxellaceae bacterium]|nr:MAG: cytochrome c oxidase assembly protein [Moraxellaceae bacterium]